MPEGTEPAAADPSTPPAPTEPGAAPSTDRTFSQADVDRIVQERLSRAKAAPPADYEDLRKKASEWDQLQEANKSEVERLNDRATAAEQRAEQLAARATQAVIRAAVVAEAARANAIDADAVLALLPADQVTVNDDGTVTGAAEAVAGVLQARPYLVGSQRPAFTPGGADGGVRPGAAPGTFTRAQLRDLSFFAANKAAILQAAKEGRITE